MSDSDPEAVRPTAVAGSRRTASRHQRHVSDGGIRYPPYIS